MGNYCRSVERSRGTLRFSGLRTVAAILLVLGVAVGCSVKLVPDFDKTLVDGLTKTNEQTLQLFAGVSNGVAASTFSQREETYNALIGSYDALRVQALSRPVPQPLILQWLGVSAGEGKAFAEIDKLQNTTPSVLANVMKTLTDMREDDRAAGLTSMRVVGFKNSYEISIDQALTVEKALER